MQTRKVIYRISGGSIFAFCVFMSFLQLREIFRDFTSKVTTSVIRNLKKNSQDLPYVTVCATSGYKGNMTFFDTEEDFIANTYDKKDFFLESEVNGKPNTEKINCIEDP